MIESLQSFGVSFAAFIVVIGVLVFVHEFGHYWMAIRNKVKVETFSIGFGPELFGWTNRHGTHWRVALIPLGGYVKMFGDVDPASVKTDDEAVAQMSDEEKKSAFFAKKVWQRSLIVAAGPGINFLFTLVVLAGLYLFIGKPYTAPLVEEVLPDLPAAEAGIQTGDKILRMNGTEIETFQDIQTFMGLNLGKAVAITLERQGTVMDVHIEPKVVDVQHHETGRLGIVGQKMEYRTLPVGVALLESVEDTWGIVRNTLVGLYQIIVGDRSTRELGSVISIAKVSGDMVADSVSATIVSLLWFMAVLSANLGLINLFPIPVLDGGHLVFYAIEAVRRKPLGEVAQEYSLRFGLAAVLALTFFALWNDLQNFGVVSYISGLIL